MGQASLRKKILKPLDAVGLDKITDIEEALKRRFGSEKAAEITAEWERLSKEADQTDRPGKQDDLYNYLHADPQLSMIVTNYTDAAIIRAFCMWLSDHRELFGKEILDVGCGTGIITCFLATILPEAHITAIDRSAGCIQTAAWVREQMGAENVEFRALPAEQLKGRTFDTVLSVRTMHENIGIRYTDNRFLSFSKQVETYENVYEEYSRLLAGLVAEGGNLVCIERNQMDTEFYSLLRTLQRQGLTIRPDCLKELQCEESDLKEKSVFQTIAAGKTGEAGIDADAEKELFDIWSEKAFSKSEDPDYFTRPQADWFTEQHKGSLLEGYSTYDAAGTQLAKACLLRMKEDPQHFLMYQANYGKAGVQILPYEALDEAKELFEDHKTIDAARGFHVKTE